MRGHVFVIVLVVAACCGASPGQGGEAVTNRHIVFMIGEREYESERTLRDFFEKDLAARGFKATFVVAPNDGPQKHEFDGFVSAMKQADLLCVSVRRRAPRTDDLNAIRQHLENGKPLVAIRTASHAFESRGSTPPGHAQWIGFDEQVLGAKYSGHYGDERFRIEVVPAAEDHPLLTNVQLRTSTKLYKGELRSPKATLLLRGRRDNGQVEPVAWTHRYGKKQARVFYTSLGLATDFESPGFRQLLLNAVRFALALPIERDDGIAAAAFP